MYIHTIYMHTIPHIHREIYSRSMYIHIVYMHTIPHIHRGDIHIVYMHTIPHMHRGDIHIVYMHTIPHIHRGDIHTVYMHTIPHIHRGARYGGRQGWTVTRRTRRATMWSTVCVRRGCWWNAFSQRTKANI